MSALGEKTLMLLLTDTESLETVVRQGVNPILLPTERFRDVLAWAKAYYQTSSVAPTSDVLRERFGADLFTDQGLDLDEDVEETITWAIEALESTWVQQETGKFTRRLATEIAAAPPEYKRDALATMASELSALVLSIQPRTTHMDIRESGPDLLAEYEMATTSDGVRGMRFNVPEIDNHLGGIWPGELVIVGGPAGSGKSFWANLVAEREWERGRNTTIFTLENSILMTQMRIACCALNIDVEDLQTGTLSEAEVDRLKEWCNDVLVASDNPLNIITPEMVNRSPQALVQQARAFETESLVIDQLSHIQPVDPRANDARNQEIGKILRVLGDLINTGRDRLPCLLLHQISREGIKAAASTGRINMTHFADASEVERAATWAGSLYQSEEMAAVGRMQLQSLKQRRVKAKSWDLSWAPWQGIVRTIGEVDFSDVL